MLYLKVLLQLTTGISGLFAVLVDYKWHDKRKKVFKNLRNGLIVLSIVSLITSTAITIFDDQDKRNEISNLQNSLDLVQTNLSVVIQNDTKLNQRLTPLIEFAHGRYPNLDLDEALDSLRSDINSLEGKSGFLEKSEANRLAKELKEDELRKKAPSIDVELKLDEKRNIYLVLNFLNDVPIKFSYSLKHSKNGITLSNSSNSPIELYPPINGKPIVMKDQFNFPDHIPKKEHSKIALEVQYESIYFIQSENPNLQRQLTKRYLIDPIKNTLSDI